MNFKVGDKAKIIGNVIHHRFDTGEIVEIREIDYLNGHYHAVNSKGEDWCVNDEELIPIIECQCDPQDLMPKGECVCGVGAESDPLYITASKSNPELIFNRPLTSAELNYVSNICENKRTFESGAVRDSNEGKSRPDLISPYFTDRLGRRLAFGAKKYDERNWEKGIPDSAFLESLERHLVAYKKGLTDEDHESAIAFNIMGIIHNQEIRKNENRS